MTFILGLTGGIGMGKSTTAQMFRDAGFPVWDADRAVHHLYAPGGAAVGPVSDAFPAALHNGGIDRAALRAELAADPGALTRLESIVHPLVGADRSAFIAAHSDAALIVLDIPLLFEGAGRLGLDGVAVVSVDAETQRARVMARPGMTAETFDMIVARQMADADKRALADWVIPTDTVESARRAVDQIIRQVAHA
ncbi:dephospho-CoA kinase [Paracoccus sp. (in: a-proteobacteria)]|uniref:dephospho-CoA kinase n=1 Tax=Paracoccus sp. TaxID=267 RepID=UPI0026E0DA3E|nr:dephospho-CoA kinase [Paracoccus sp. (in: a-proteobacteria)]MDO5647495.1 dephospho-CoA kinase [Paracoccus sp. (in: a-proteobacteria)]